MLNEREMRKTLLDLGLDGTKLEVYDTSNKTPKVAMELKGAKLRELAEVLEVLADKIQILQRRGLDFADLMALRKGSKLPAYWIVVGGKDIFCYSQKEFQAQLEKYEVASSDEELNGNGNGNGHANGKNGQAEKAEENDKKAKGKNGQDSQDIQPLEKVEKKAELHEIKDIEKLIEQVKQFGISIEDYFLVREEAVTGEKEPPKYILSSDGDNVDVDGVAGIVPGIRELGSRGMEIKRFKGLGEMNDDQLWETTMDPARRVLLRVKAEEAEEAERMFSVLMGNDVEKRRQFIEAHALEVKNLDI